jgi:hypothetical protein
MAKTLITSGQEKQYKRFFDDVRDKALEEAGLDKDGLQKLIENWDEFRSRVVTAVRELSVNNQFADEEVESSYGYLSDYKPKGITGQTNRLRELFPGIGYADEKLAEATLPPNAEGWFAIPRWEKIASTYGEAVQKVLDLIKQTRDGKFHNYREGKLGPQHLRQHSKTAKMFQTIGEEQKDHDILVVPAQFGLNHRGKSVRRAREVMNASEFGLGAFATGIMILTHPERLQDYNDLWIDCAGDEYAPDADDDFSHAPYFGFGGGRVEFGTNRIGRPSGSYGSASGFVPQS